MGKSSAPAPSAPAPAAPQVTTTSVEAVERKNVDQRAVARRQQTGVTSDLIGGGAEDPQRKQLSPGSNLMA